jgi:hypothetical protein
MSAYHLLLKSKMVNNAATTTMTIHGVYEDRGIAGKGTGATGERARCLMKASVRLAWAGVGLVNVGRPIGRVDRMIVWL